MLDNHDLLVHADDAVAVKASGPIILARLAGHAPLVLSVPPPPGGIGVIDIRNAAELENPEL